MRDRERGTRWMNVAHIHAPSGRHGSRSGCMRAARPCACRRSTPAACRAFSTFEQTPDGGPVGAYRGGEPIATTRAWTRGYFAAAHFRPLLRLHAVWTFGGVRFCELSIRRRIAPYKQAGYTQRIVV